MKKITAIILLASVAFACRYSTSPAENELKDKLKDRMTIFLYESNKLYTNNTIDSSTSKFNVLDVTYFADAGFYACTFKVHLHERNLDTTGVMRANITNDFTKVVRKY